MTLQVPPDLQYGLLDFIAHVNIEDYDSLPADFVKIGFTPPDKLEQVKRSGLAEGLSFGLRQLGKGGGPAKIRERVAQEFRDRYGGNLSDDELRKKIREEMVSRMENQLKEEGVDVNGVTGIMEEMSRRNREMFKLPPYVLYVSRAFSTLEGIGLSVAEDFSILKESYPYLAKRLMTDNSPRAQAALRTMLFESNNGKSGLLSTSKLIEMSDGFTSYTAATADAERDTEGKRIANEALASVLLSPDGNFVQDIVLEGAARVTDSVLRSGYHRVSDTPLGKLIKRAVVAPKNIAYSVLPPKLRVLALPVTLPYEIAVAIDHILDKDPSDDEAVLALRSVVDSLQAQLLPDSGVSAEVSDKSIQVSDSTALTSGSTISELRDRVNVLTSDPSAIVSQLPLVATLSRRFTASLLSRAADRFEKKTLPVDVFNSTLPDEVILRNFVSNTVGVFAASSARSLAAMLTRK